MNNIEDILQVFAENNPNPSIELDYTNNFTLLVAVVLSARMTDKGVNKATKELFKKADSPEAMLNLGEDGLRSYIKTIGLYPTKAKNIIALSKILVSKHNGNVPDNMDALIGLPGVGRKSANVILNTAFGKSTMPVDTHVQRVSNRLGFSAHKDPNKVEQDLLKIIPSALLGKAHHWLVLHGRYVCKSQRPKCDKCPVSQWCRFINQ
jgi:endonuclease-3